MRFVVAAARDSKAELFSQPHFFRSKGEAMRSYTDAVNDPQSMFNKHPEDFTFFVLGEYDDVEGTLVASATGPHVLALAATLFVAGGVK